jgi:hypothetical protein
MSDGYPTDEQLLSQARKLRREAHELERIGHALSLAAGRRRFLDDARALHARADRLEAQVRNATRGADSAAAETPPKARTPGAGEPD